MARDGHAFLLVYGLADEEVLLAFNRTIAARLRNRDELGEHVATEIPVGKAQVEHYPGTCTQWVPRGDVLRCYIEDGGGQDGSLPVI